MTNQYPVCCVYALVVQLNMVVPTPISLPGAPAAEAETLALTIADYS
jgi:hypothetical protein